jgi:hypothetical protein
MALSQKELEVLVEGKQEIARATFYEKAKLDVSGSKEVGHRVYRTATYIKLHQPGITDNISYVAQPHDIAEYPEEYEHFLSHRQGTQTGVMIDIIPGLTITHKQELIDMGLSTIESLAAANTVPPHLEYAKVSATALNLVLQEQDNGNIEEIHNEEIHNEKTHETKTVHEAHRQSNDSDVGQCIVPGSLEGRRNDPPKRVQESGQVNSGSGVASPTGLLMPDSNWKIAF